MIRPGSDFWTSRKIKIKAGRPPKHVGGRWPPGGTANKVVTRLGDKISKSNVSQFFPPSCLNQESPFKSTLFPAKDLVPDLCEGVGDEWFRWRRRRRGVWLQLYTVSRPSGSENNSTLVFCTGSKPVPTQPLLRLDTVWYRLVWSVVWQ